MQTLRNPLLYIATAVVAIICTASSCRPDSGAVGVNASPTGTNIVADVGWNISSNATAHLNGSVNPVTGDWTAGFVIQFKDATIPAAEGVKLADLGGIPDAVRSLPAGAAPNTWTFPKVRNPSDPAFQRAVAIAASIGSYTLVPLRVSTH
jgi:hypothetical protein